MDIFEYEALVSRRLAADDMCTALHEAGHAMLADALNVEIECVSIKNLRDGHTTPPAYVLLKPAVVQHEIVIALAGRAVDSSLGADNSCQVNPFLYETDERILEASRRRLFPAQRSGTEGFFHYNRTLPLIQDGWVLRWVRENESAIQKFATLLVEKRELCGKELVACLQQAWNGMNPDFAALDREVKEQVEQLRWSD